jgi:putative salt-induced outer membrane protein YdiY
VHLHHKGPNSKLEKVREQQQASTHMKENWFRFGSSVVALLVSLSAVSLSAADTNKWETSAAAGLSLTRGNSETLLATIGINSTRKTANDEILLGAAGAYGENTVEDKTTGKEDTQKTAESISAYGQYNHSINDRWYAGVRLDFLHDAIADLDYRFTLSPLVGYYAVKKPMTTLKFEAGPSGVIERQGEEDNQYIALRLAERFDHKFSDKAKMWQSLEYLPQVDRFHNYLLIFELGAEASLTQKLSLRGVFQDLYDNEPAAGRKKNDMKLITSLVYKFQ